MGVFMFARPTSRSVVASIYKSLLSPNPTPAVRLSPHFLTRSFSLHTSNMAQEWKLKDLPKIDLKDLDKVEVEVEGIEGGKVLLVKVGDQISALNTNCTHYGAPLKNGVLTPEGRLTCPWHGACFNTKTGDVEDSPAPLALNKFNVIEKDGGVYITGKEADIKGGKRQDNVKTTPSTDEKVVIVGGGSGTFGAILKLRELGFQGHVTVITGEAFPYTKLILATGGTPRNLPLPGFQDLSNIFLLRQISDTHAIMDAVGDGNKKIVIIGSSFIGMEVANALAKNNSVSIVGMESAPMERVMGAEVGKIFQKNLEKNGGKFYMKASVDSAVPASKLANAVGLSSVRAVKLKDGTELEADLVILGIGVKPATEYLENNPKIKLEKD